MHSEPIPLRATRSFDMREADSDPCAPFELVRPKHDSGAGPPDPQGSAQGYRAGDVLGGKYQLLRILGQGGMSTVWVAQNVVLDAQFALKLIDTGEGQAAERLLREARSAARIDHPAIVRALDFGVTDRGDPFLVMDLLSGASVRERLREEGRLTPVEAVQLLLPIAEALSVAHSRGVVHRDLKPDNIVCATEGAGRCQPKIVDFGIARQLDQASPRSTLSGTVLGSPEYMSPEQVEGLPDVGHETDIWSFSVTLYEMVTGTTPFFRSGGCGAILRAIIEEPAAPIAQFGIHDPELWSIVSRGLRKAPDARWEDMHSLGAALARWLLRQGVEDDVCMQSLRMVWLGTSSSAPPVAIDVHGDAERTRLLALQEAYEVPRVGLFRTTLGLAAAALTVTLIGVAGFYTARRAVPVTPMTVMSRPRPPPPAVSSTPPPTMSSTPVPAAPPALVLSPATAAGAEEETAAETERGAPPAPAAGTEEPGAEKAESVAHATSAAAAEEPGAKKAKGVAHATHTTAASKARARLARRASRPPAPTWAADQRPAGTTLFPDVKPPPEFGDGALPSPRVGADKASAGGASDNPYGD